MKRQTSSTTNEQLDVTSGGSSGGTVDQGNGNGGSSPWSIALPTGASTAANQSTGNTLLNSILTTLSGTLSVLITNVTLAVTQSGSWILSAGTALIGQVYAGLQTGLLYSGTTSLTPKYAAITASGSGATTIVAAVTSKKIRIINIVVIANGTVNVKFQSHVSPTDITGLLYLTTNTGFAPGEAIQGHFETIAGEALDINLSGAIAVGGWLTYVEI